MLVARCLKARAVRSVFSWIEAWPPSRQPCGSQSVLLRTHLPVLVYQSIRPAPHVSHNWSIMYNIIRPRRHVHNMVCSQRAAQAASIATSSQLSLWQRKSPCSENKVSANGALAFIPDDVICFCARRIQSSMEDPKSSPRDLPVATGVDRRALVMRLQINATAIGSAMTLHRTKVHD